MESHLFKVKKAWQTSHSSWPKWSRVGRRNWGSGGRSTPPPQECKQNLLSNGLELLLLSHSPTRFSDLPTALLCRLAGPQCRSVVNSFSFLVQSRSLGNLLKYTFIVRRININQKLKFTALSWRPLSILLTFY